MMLTQALLPALADSRDVVALDTIRHALIEARHAIARARDLLHSWDAAKSVEDLIVSLEGAVDDVQLTADKVAEEDEEREARRSEAKRCFSPYHRA